MLDLSQGIHPASHTEESAVKLQGYGIRTIEPSVDILPILQEVEKVSLISLSLSPKSGALCDFIP
jgi:hypothetical protein